MFNVGYVQFFMYIFNINVTELHKVKAPLYICNSTVKKHADIL